MAPKGQKRKSVGGDGDQTGRPLSQLPSSTAIGAAITTPLCTKIVEWFIGCIPVFVVLCLISAFWFNTCVEGGKPTSGHWVESTSTSWPSLQVRWVDKSLLSKFAVEVGSHDLPLFHKSFLTKASHMAWRLGFVNVESHVSSRFYLCFDPEAWSRNGCNMVFTVNVSPVCFVPAPGSANYVIYWLTRAMWKFSQHRWLLHLIRVGLGLLVLYWSYYVRRMLWSFIGELGCSSFNSNSHATVVNGGTGVGGWPMSDPMQIVNFWMPRRSNHEDINF